MIPFEISLYILVLVLDYLFYFKLSKRKVNLLLLLLGIFLLLFIVFGIYRPILLKSGLGNVEATEELFRRLFGALIILFIPFYTYKFFNFMISKIMMFNKWNRMSVEKPLKIFKVINHWHFFVITIIFQFLVIFTH